ncbi:MAG TPA: energy transducer TonB [Terriglobales bacterium]|nr:energy transducer TonB [Terriglobales bacterium]
MSITPTTPRDSSPPPAQETPGLYDARHWESAYRHFDEDAVPALLLHLQDDLTRSRRREAAWLSVIVHLLVIILFVNQPRLEGFYRRVFLHQQPITRVSVQDLLKQRDLTYLELPPDLQKLTERPKTNVMSDKDRVATTKTPQVDPKELRKLFASSHPGVPKGMQGQGQDSSSIQPAPAPAQPAQQTAPQPQQPPQQNSQPGQIAQLQLPRNPAEPPVKFGGNISAGSAIEQATRAAAQNRGGYGGEGGDFGLSQGKAGGILGQAEILSDTMGVDFEPYLRQVVHRVRENWIPLIPEAAVMKKGWATVDFYILKDGTVTGIKPINSSGDVTLERAAYGSISLSNPFAQLPREFPGPYLQIRLRFLYNLNADGTDPDVR